MDQCVLTVRTTLVRIFMCKLFDLKLISTAVRGLIPDLLYDKLVWPTSIRIYEVFNPGAVVRILACDSSPEELRGSVDYARYNDTSLCIG